MSSQDRWIVRAALIGVIISGIFSGIYFITYTDVNLLNLTDFQTYRTSIIYALDNKQFVGTEPYYVYLPITVILYLPLALLPINIAYVTLFLINTLGGVLVYAEVIKIFDMHSFDLERVDKILIFGSILLSPTLIGNLFNGQPNYLILACILGGYRYITVGRDNIGGILFALPAIIKLWPALLGLWLLYRRSYKGLISAASTGTSAIIISIIIFGYETNITYFTYILTQRSWTSRFSGGLDPSAGLVSIRRFISMAVPTMGPDLMMMVGFLILSPILYLYYQADDSSVGDLATLEAIIILVLLALPSIYPYYILVFAPALPLIYTIDNKILSAIGSFSLFLSVFTINATKFTSISSTIFPESSSHIISGIFYHILSFITPPAVGCLGIIFVLYLSYMNDEELTDQ